MLTCKKTHKEERICQSFQYWFVSDVVGNGYLALRKSRSALNVKVPVGMKRKRLRKDKD